jgi:benzoyl-CoA-dihydrodiol lyase
VLPGTGGLTRLTDKRKVRHDLADVFCTVTEGVRGQRAKDWRLVDAIAKPGEFAGAVSRRAQELAMPRGMRGIALTPLAREDRDDGYRYAYVDVAIDRAARTATITVQAPATAQPADIAGIEAAGAAWWPLQMARELDDAILTMRTNELAIGTWLFKTTGDAKAVLACDAALATHQDHWLVRETIGMLRRTLARLDVSSRTLFALIEPGSCFAGTLLELALAADRAYMLRLPEEPSREPGIAVSSQNFGPYPMVNGQTRLTRRFCDDASEIAAVERRIGDALTADDAMDLGLVTSAPDDLDWDDEIRIAIEERASMSPDALTGMEANLRFGGTETMATRIFGRLSAWQNWIFNRPNAVGDKGALKVYGKGGKAQFDFDRV